MIAGALIYYVAKLASEAVGLHGPYAFLGWLGATLAAPLLFGFFYRRHAWQWGIYIIIGQIIFIVATENGDLNQLPIGIVLYGALAILAMLTATIGGYIAKRYKK